MAAADVLGQQFDLPPLYSKQVVVQKPPKRKEKEPVDTRTPSGKVLPY